MQLDHPSLWIVLVTDLQNENALFLSKSMKYFDWHILLYDSKNETFHQPDQPRVTGTTPPSPPLNLQGQWHTPKWPIIQLWMTRQNIPNPTPDFSPPKGQRENWRQWRSARNRCFSLRRLPAMYTCCGKSLASICGSQEVCSDLPSSGWCGTCRLLTTTPLLISTWMIGSWNEWEIFVNLVDTWQQQVVNVAWNWHIGRKVLFPTHQYSLLILALELCTDILDFNENWLVNYLHTNNYVTRGSEF